MNRVLLLLVAVLMGLSAKANYTVTTTQPLYPNNVYDYPSVQQPYNQGYYQDPYQAQAQNSYINPYQQPYASPYQPYGYRNNIPFSILNSATTGLGSSTGTTGIVKNIGRSLLYSMMRGY